MSAIPARMNRRVDAWIEVYTEEVGPKRGAEVVARAWTDPAYRERLLANGADAVDELGLPGIRVTPHLQVVENTPKVHNLVVCTLCSCYPIGVLANDGLSPKCSQRPRRGAMV